MCEAVLTPVLGRCPAQAPVVEKPAVVEAPVRKAEVKQVKEVKQEQVRRCLRCTTQPELGRCLRAALRLRRIAASTARDGEFKMQATSVVHPLDDEGYWAWFFLAQPTPN